MADSWSEEYFSVPQELQRYDIESSTVIVALLELLGLTGVTEVAGALGVPVTSLADLLQKHRFPLLLAQPKPRTHQKVAAAVMAIVVPMKAKKLLGEWQIAL